MKNFLEFDQDDKKLWLGIAAAVAIYVIAFSLFWKGGVFYHLEKAFATLLVIVLPGYVIMKLFLDKVTISDNRIADKLMVSFGLSIASMIVPYFMTTYLRPYVFNTDEEGWGIISNTGVTMILLVLVLGIAFGLKYYQNKKNGLV
jgi:uncharacterized membrane protein